ncbi:MAG: hypothetical protein KAH32_07975 [Chlamydiia bacterium]|nr:hypothetical protein [Chlamydiia bacterium]
MINEDLERKVLSVGSVVMLFIMLSVIYNVATAAVSVSIIALVLLLMHSIRDVNSRADMLVIIVIASLLITVVLVIMMETLVGVLSMGAIVLIGIKYVGLINLNS